MGKQAIDGVIAIVTCVIALAIIGVLVSQGSNTGNIITQAGAAFSGILKAAMPGSGSSSNILSSLPAATSNQLGSNVGIFG